MEIRAYSEDYLEYAQRNLGNMLDFAVNTLESKRVYYKKDLEGNVIGLVNELGHEFTTYSYDVWGNLNQTSCLSGYETSINEQVEHCQTSSLLFESLRLYVTNCYGFVTNRWMFKNMGSMSKLNPEGDFSHYCTEQVVAGYVQSDFAKWGKEVQILTGSDNNPYYETDSEHCLIALRVMTNVDYVRFGRYADAYHFMIRKDDGWYFKEGKQYGILKLKGNNTPNTVNWNLHSIGESGKYEVFVNDFYNSSTQYIVIPKMPLTIV